VTRVLFVMTASDRWTLNDGTVHPSGYWAEEAAVPHRVFSAAGWGITVATPGGVAPTLDRLSVGIAGGLPWKVRRIERYLEGIRDELDHPVALDAADADDYDLVFSPGGHGPMEDLAHDATSGALLTKRLASGRPLALLCHASAAVVATVDERGVTPFAGRRMTALSNREERFNRFARRAPWLLEDKLRELGVVYSKGRLPLRPHIVVDGNLFTGQNPQSSERLAERLVAEVGSSGG